MRMLISGVYSDAEQAQLLSYLERFLTNEYWCYLFKVEWRMLHATDEKGERRITVVVEGAEYFIPVRIGVHNALYMTTKRTDHSIVKREENLSVPTERKRMS